MSLRASFWATFLAREASLVSGFLSTLLLARSLGPSGQGAYSLVVNGALLLAIPAGLGSPHANTFLVAQSSSSGGTLVLQSLLVPLLTIPLLALLLIGPLAGV